MMESPAPTPPPRLEPRASVVLPLTTIFTPPSSCFDAPFTLSTSASGIVGFSTAWRDQYETSSQCYPPSFSSLEYPWNWYSPGVCASGYNIAQTTTNEDVTSAWCCPLGFTITGSVGGDITYQLCSSLASDTAIIGLVNNATATFTPTGSFVALQYPISVQWASSDLSIFTPASAPVLTTGSSSTISKFTGTLVTGGGRTSGPTSTPQVLVNEGLSTGAKAGIAVGVVVAVAALLAGIIFWFRRRRRSKQTLTGNPGKGDRSLYVDNKIELPTAEERRQKVQTQSPVELNAMGGSPQELEVGNHAAKKVNNEQSPIELEGNWYGNERPG